MKVEYEPLEAAVDVDAGDDAGCPVLHEAIGSNIANEQFIQTAIRKAPFAAADHVFELPYRFPKYCLHADGNLWRHRAT